MEQYQATVDQIQAILDKVVPNAFTKVQVRKNFFGGDYIAIHIAAGDHEINRVQGQYVAHVSLRLDLETMQLETQVYGGSGGQCIYRQPDLTHEREKYYAMIPIKIPFRRPKPNMEAISKCIEKFAVNWKQAIVDNMETLTHRDCVDYKKAIS